MFVKMVMLIIAALAAAVANVPGNSAALFTHSDHAIGTGTAPPWLTEQSTAILPKNTDTDPIIAIVPDTSHSFTKASVFNRQQGAPKCNTGFSSGASSYEVSQRISDLKARTDDCGLAAGACGMLECAYNAGIQWCNKNDHYASWKCADFATHAQAARDACSFETFFGAGEETWGMTPDEQSFEVWVGYYPC